MGSNVLQHCICYYNIWFLKEYWIAKWDKRYLLTVVPILTIRFQIYKKC